MELNSDLSPTLTARVINLLNKNNILTITDFVKEDPFKLSQVTNSGLEAIHKIKNDILSKFQPYSRIYCQSLIKTGIDNFDALLGGGLTSGYLYDICGLFAAGKTQMCNTIAINLAINYNYQTLYIDAKKDFSGSRIYKILDARNCSDSAVIMDRIRCESIGDVDDFLKILRELPAYLADNKQAKCLVVDSLPALWFPLLDGKRNGVPLLCEAANLMRKIAYLHDMIILLVNIVTRRTEIEFDTSEKSEYFKTKTTVALGKYWQTVPHQRFLMYKIEGCRSECISQRIIKIIGRSGKVRTCNVNITNKGVV